MDESGNHLSQQIDTRIENQTQHVLTHSQVLNNANSFFFKSEIVIVFLSNAFLCINLQDHVIFLLWFLIGELQ